MFTPRLDAFTIATSDTLSQRIIGKKLEDKPVSVTYSTKQPSAEFLVAEEEQLRKLHVTYCSLKSTNQDQAEAYKNFLKERFLKEFVFITGTESKSDSDSVSSLYDKEQDGLNKMLELLTEFRKTSDAHARSTASFKEAFSKFIIRKLKAVNSKSDVDNHDEAKEVIPVKEPEWLEAYKKRYRGYLERLEKSKSYPANKELAESTESCERAYRVEFINTMTRKDMDWCRKLAVGFDFATLVKLLDQFSTPDHLKLDQSTFKLEFKKYLITRFPKDKLKVPEEKAPPAPAPVQATQPVVTPPMFSWNRFKQAVQRFASWLGSFLFGFHSENRIQHPTSPLPTDEQQVLARIPEQSGPSSYKTLAEHGLLIESEDEQLLHWPPPATTRDWLEKIERDYKKNLSSIESPKTPRAMALELERLNRQAFLSEMTGNFDCVLVTRFSFKQLYKSLCEFSTPDKVRLNKPCFQTQFKQYLKDKLALQQPASRSDSELTESLRSRV